MPDSRLEGPGFESRSRCRHVSGSVLIQPPCRNVSFTLDHLPLTTRTGQRGRVRQQHVIGIGEVRKREECFTTLQIGHLLYHSKANNGQAGVDFLINRRWNVCITKPYKLKIEQYMHQQHHTQKKTLIVFITTSIRR